MTAPTQSRRTQAQARYQRAAETAAAMYVASKTPLDPVDIVRHTVASAADLTEAVAVSTTAAIVALWRRTDPYDQKSVNTFTAKAGKLVVSAQRTTGTINTAAMVNQLKAIGINTKVSVTLPDQVRGAQVEFGKKLTVVPAPKTVIEYTAPTPHPEPVTTPIVPSAPAPARESDHGTSAPVRRQVEAADSAPDHLFNRAVVTYRYERSTGASHATATKAAEARIEDLTETNVMLAQRLAEQQTLVWTAVDLDQKILGYRRVIHPELSRGGTCGLCVAVSDRVYKLSTLKAIHFRCKCTISPITEDFDPGFRLNREDLDTLYAHAGTTSGRTKGKNLKHTRYIIEDHHELGPVLTRVKGDKQVESLPAPDNRPTPDPYPHTGATGSGGRTRTYVGGRRTAGSSPARTPRPAKPPTPPEAPEQALRRQREAVEQLRRLPEILIAQGLSPDSAAVQQARTAYKQLRAALDKAQKSA